MIDFLALLASACLWVAALYYVLEWHAAKRLPRISAGSAPRVEIRRAHLRGIPKELLRACEAVERENATEADDPPLAVGEECYFLGYAAVADEAWPMLVEAADRTHVLASWAGHVQLFPRVTVRRWTGLPYDMA